MPGFGWAPCRTQGLPLVGARFPRRGILPAPVLDAAQVGAGPTLRCTTPKPGFNINTANCNTGMTEVGEGEEDVFTVVESPSRMFSLALSVRWLLSCGPVLATPSPC